MNQNEQQKLEDEQKNKNLESLKSFFKSNSNIKNSLMKDAPKQEDDYDKESRIKYIDRLYKELKDFEAEFINISKNFDFGIDVNKEIKSKFKQLKKEIIISKYDKGIIKSLYQNIFSQMDEKLIEEIKGTFIGYTMISPRNLEEYIKKSNTINELLHVFHSYITNNEKIIEAMPLIDSKENDFKYSINLYGDKNEFSMQLFEGFPKDMDVGYTDIISMENKILMMIRDRGHALTIDIDKEQEKYMIKYFIPKLCNREMVENLPGIDKIGDNSAIGLFETSKEDIMKKLFAFIESVPTDSDIPRKVKNDNHMQDIQEQITQTIEQDNEKIFSIEDAKEMTMEVGKNGRRMSRIIAIQQRIKWKLEQIHSKDKGENENDNSIRN